MNFLMDKKGNLSWLRVSILIAALGTLFLVGSVLAFFLDQSSRNGPLVIEVPAGAIKGNEVVLAPAWKQIYYRVPGDNIDAVAEFYKTRMRSFYNSTAGEETGETCQRIPPAGYFTPNPNEANGIYDANFVVGESLPVVWKCLFDRSGLNNSQTTEVWIYAGLPNPDPKRDSTGFVVIRHEQRWQS
jgi:hypothetical protein